MMWKFHKINCLKGKTGEYKIIFIDSVALSVQKITKKSIYSTKERRLSKKKLM